MTFHYGPPKFHSENIFYWFTFDFTAICEIYVGIEESCYINKSSEELKFLKGINIYNRLISKPENSCQ